MSGDALAFASIAEVAELIRSRRLSCVELVSSALDRIARLDAELNACTVVLAEQAARAARARDDGLAAGGPLHGVPVVVKDNIDVAGVPTTAGSPLLGSVTAPAASAPAVRALERSGAIVVAKANMYELAYGGPNPAFGAVRNPWGEGLTSGGSSSGPAVAVAAGLAYAALGTDSGGSIRIPAGYCGVAGLKPTFDRVPAEGIVGVSSTLDHVGPIARTAGDLAVVMEAVATRALDPSVGVANTRDPSLSLAGVRVGVAAGDAYEPVQAEVREALAAAETTLRAAGAETTVVSVPSLDVARDVKWTISGFEAAAAHRALLDAARERLEPALRRLLEEGERVSVAEYEAALQQRDALRAALDTVFAGVDALLLPALPTTAFPAGAATVTVGDRHEDALRSTTRFMSLFNVTGHPAAVVPVGLDANRRPLSLQVAAALGHDAVALRVAHAIERPVSPSDR